MKHFLALLAVSIALPAFAGEPDLAVYPEDAVPLSLKKGPKSDALTGDEIKQLKNGDVVWALIDNADNPVKKGVAVGVIDTKPENVFATLGDYENLKDFMPYVTKTTVDERAGNVTTVSFVLSFPLGISGRNYQLKLTDGPKTVDGVKIYTSEWVYTGKGNIIDTTGSWEVCPWGKDKSFVRYTVFTDPGGSFPNWIKNKATGTAMTNVLNAVRERVKSPNARKPPAE